MTEYFQQDIQTLMPIIVRFLGSGGFKPKTLQNMTDASTLKNPLSQSELFRVIEGLAKSYSLSATTRDFILFHEQKLALTPVSNVIILSTLEACNDSVFQPHKSQIVDKKQKN
ncbi:hypothetical protein THMIRHAS_04950 [Thiosulfatimonas sediminis]|uniref:Uncharacterized protein n=1 Tax=Thiosulfatimonas sediminis TaxID=2675054 RepID=A0A6F8PSL0_9GAMM|nr:hypothetical protein [Thiosulfatimonas sediminis]BBP45122.1 hypothetical protein THMIRHAS_04950 [Thiosulfatimonas sediminis]